MFKRGRALLCAKKYFPETKGALTEKERLEMQYKHLLEVEKQKNLRLGQTLSSFGSLCILGGLFGFFAFIFIDSSPRRRNH